MKVLKNDSRNDLRLLIEISCISLENKELFEQFHKMLIAISYSATDVCIDHRQKKIYMNVLAEDSKGDFLRRIDNFLPTTASLKLSYEYLSEFLMDSIKDKNAIPQHYYSLLKSQFFKEKSLFEKLHLLEKA